MLQSATLDEFHAVTLAPTFLLFAAWHAYRRSYVWFVAFAVLAMGCKEEIGLLVTMMSCALLVFRRHEPAARFVGLCMALAGVIWPIVALEVIVPNADSDGQPSPYWARLIYDNPPLGLHFGPPDVLRTWKHNPGQLIQTITLPAKQQFVTHYLVPSGFLALLGLDVFLLALPSLGLLAVTREYHIFAGIGHYTAELIPFVFLASLVGMRRLARTLTARIGIRRIYVITACCAVLLVGGVTAQVQSGFTPLRAAMGPPAITPHARLAQQLLDLIPPQAAVSAQQGLGPHLGERSQIYLFPDLGYHQQAQYVALDLTDDSFPESPVDVYNQAQQMLTSGHWGVRFADDGLLLLQRGVAQKTIPPAFFSFINLQNRSAANSPGSCSLRHVS